MNKKRAVFNFVLAVLGALLYVVVAVPILWGAFRTPGFSPSPNLLQVFSLLGGAIIVFVSARLGIAIGATGLKRLRNGIRTTMGWEYADILLLLDLLVVVVVGFFFVVLYLQPGLIAVPKGSEQLTAAPEYIATPAMAFVGLIVGAIAIGVTPTPPTSIARTQ